MHNSLYIQRLSETPAARWSGGVTYELALWPREAAYSRRDFLWRVSTARVELEESDFTSLPQYRRCILTLDKVLKLSHDRGPVIRLEPFTPYEFEGGSATHAWGQVSDFNLMLRRDAAWGQLSVCTLQPGQWQSLSPRPNGCCLLFCAQGRPALSRGGRPGCLCRAGDYLLWSRDLLHVINPGPDVARLILAQMGPGENNYK